MIVIVIIIIIIIIIVNIVIYVTYVVIVTINVTVVHVIIAICAAIIITTIKQIGYVDTVTMVMIAIIPVESNIIVIIQTTTVAETIRFISSIARAGATICIINGFAFGHIGCHAFQEVGHTPINVVIPLCLYILHFPHETIDWRLVDSYWY